MPGSRISAPPRRHFLAVPRWRGQPFPQGSKRQPAWGQAKEGQVKRRPWRSLFRLSALAAGAALTLTAVAVPAQAAQLPLGNEGIAFVNSVNPLFYHASPLGANVPCHPSAAHPYPVVLVEGTFASMYH